MINFESDYQVQWYTNNGQCGVCGDNYNDPTPRDNELGGKYGGIGKIVATYENSLTAIVGVRITANHLGYIYFNICNLDEFPEESEKCFAKYRLKFADGSDKYYIGTTLGWIESNLIFPMGLSCEHCVLRWTYKAGNNWGICENGTGALGCGRQEHFKSCADISIKAPSDIDNHSFLNEEIPIVIDNQPQICRI